MDLQEAKIRLARHDGLLRVVKKYLDETRKWREWVTDNIATLQDIPFQKDMMTEIEAKFKDLLWQLDCKIRLIEAPLTDHICTECGRHVYFTNDEGLRNQKIYEEHVTCPECADKRGGLDTEDSRAHTS